ncbi:hydrogenase subunit MbhD domain-containing protein [Niabella hibiscisoli]|uniref:hydrogenase subunit MbhD domain-containing protein n=1 Tax=Niabella hibiscisoli TaxID=1825928 RepID=UPI001F0FA3F3|nr:hydrogenase subunit MbhD domain-containing protein [Niabella hibiscisoli]MCH5715211.1 DUF4040 domain-containing protein [Niabella hibiscisoli]
MWLPPLILAVLGVVFGLMPHYIGEVFSLRAANTMFGADTQLNLKIWHGFNTVLFLSLLTLAAGTALYFFNKPSHAKSNAVHRFKVLAPEFLTERFTAGIFKFSDWYTSTFHNGYLRSYHLKIILFTEALLAYKLWLSGPIDINFYNLAMLSVYEVAIVAILIGALIIMITTRTRLTAVVAMSVIGYCICLMFVFYSAPDLAMTQFTIDTLTTVLFVLVLYKLPPF